MNSPIGTTMVKITAFPKVLKAKRFKIGVPLRGSIRELNLRVGKLGIKSEIAISALASAPPNAPRWNNIYAKRKISEVEKKSLKSESKPLWVKS